MPNQRRNGDDAFRPVYLEDLQNNKQPQGFVSSFAEDAPYADPIPPVLPYQYSEYNTYNKPNRERERISKKSKKQALNLIYGTVCLLCLLVMAFTGYLLFPQLTGKVWHNMPSYGFVGGNLITYDAEKVAELKRNKSYMDRDTIFPGVYIDQVHVGDMTPAQAKQVLLNTEQSSRKSFSLEIQIGQESFPLSSDMLTISRNIDPVIEQAYAYGRNNSALLSGSSLTPLQERFDSAVSYRNEGKSLFTEWTYDKQAVKSYVEQIAQHVKREPVNSEIAEFDFNKRKFSFTEDQNGQSVDAEELYAKVIEKLDTWEQGMVLKVEPKLSFAEIRKLDMMNNFKMVAAYTTSTKGTKERLSNIDLACKSINGYVLMPGQTFSFNEVVGQRTIEKGYKEAGAMLKGQLVPDVGGGICQVSTTLYNAVVRADVEVTKRNNHAWPISYISIGEDAAVNWPNLDLTFRNNKNSPIFILMYYNSKSTSCEIWGLSMGEGMTIELESKVLRQIAPPAEPEYVLNTNLPYGTQKVTVDARTGYEVETYKIWKKNGQEVKREKLHTTTYKAYQQRIEYNSENPR